MIGKFYITMYFVGASIAIIAAIRAGLERDLVAVFFNSASLAGVVWLMIAVLGAEELASAKQRETSAWLDKEIGEI